MLFTVCNSLHGIKFLQDLKATLEATGRYLNSQDLSLNLIPTKFIKTN